MDRVPKPAGPCPHGGGWVLFDARDVGRPGGADSAPFHVKHTALGVPRRQRPGGMVVTGPQPARSSAAQRARLGVVLQRGRLRRGAGVPPPHLCPGRLARDPAARSTVHPGPTRPGRGSQPAREPRDERRGPFDDHSGMPGAPRRARATSRSFRAATRGDSARCPVLRGRVDRRHSVTGAVPMKSASALLYPMIRSRSLTVRDRAAAVKLPGSRGVQRHGRPTSRQTSAPTSQRPSNANAEGGFRAARRITPARRGAPLVHSP
jgi:hypothetical protein